ncbi:MAG: hypothetical protein JWP74_2812 [Marmoricola sp.]|nr:hypothetical protein [Marmoricola sp.]
MEIAILAGTGGAVAALLVVALIASLRRNSRSRSDLEAMLAAAQHEVDLLRARLDEVTAGSFGVLEPPAPRRKRGGPAFVITDAGSSVPDLASSTDDQVPVPDRLVLTATLGAPLVKVAAFGHGVRRALAPETRNRIWFEMRREVRASRKRRRRLLREYQRDLRTEDRAGEGLA